MVVGDEFVFLHMPKTGGTFLSHVLAAVPGARILDHHKHRTRHQAEAAGTLAGKAIVGSVRHPFTWYESRFGFAVLRSTEKRAAGKFPLKDEEALAGGVDDFIARVTDPDYLARRDDVVWRRAAYALPVYRIMRARRMGLMTFEFVLTFARDPDAVFAREGPFEMREDDFSDMDWIRIEKAAADVAAIAAASGFPAPSTDIPESKSNARDREVVEPVSAASRARLAEWDAGLIGRFYGGGAGG